MARRMGWRRGLAGLLVAAAALATPAGGGSAAYAEDRLDRFNVANRKEDQTEPRISGDWVVWKDYRNLSLRAVDDSPNGEIFAWDIANEREVRVARSRDAGQPAISGTIVVWTEGGERTTEIHGVDLTNGEVFAVTSSSGRQEHPAISGSLIVWQDNRNGNWDIYARDLNKNGDFPLVENGADQQRPAISGKTVVWEDLRDSGSGPNIYGFSVETGKTFRLTKNNDAYEPAIDGPWVVWVGRVDHGVFARNLETEKQIRLSSGHGPKSHPSISGDLVVWAEERDQGYDVYAYDLSKGKQLPIVRDGGDQDSPWVDDGTIVWSDGRGNNRDIYAARLNKPARKVTTAEPPASTTAPAQPASAAAPAPPTAEQVRVTGTSGSSVNLRSSPGLNGPRIKGIPEGTILTATGEPRQADGLTWRSVRDATGAEGWVAAEYLSVVSSQ